MPYAPTVPDPAHTHVPPSSAARSARIARVVIAGGGTGGHVFPAIAVAERLAGEGTEVAFVGTARGLEARIVPEHGFPLHLLDLEGIKGRGLRGLFRGISRLPRACFESRAILAVRRPDVVLGVGGYASGPLVAVAALSGIPTVILEQNSVPGITNRLLGRLVDRVCVSYDASRSFPQRKVVHTGNPIRAEIVARIRKAVDDSVRRSTDPVLLVLGGSQGARAINDAMMRAAPRLLRSVPGLRIVHQTGRADEARVRGGYGALAASGGPVVVRPFIDDMAAAYAEATLVLSRAGATTLAELAVAGRPAVLVPFPYATDDHQTKNAEAFVRAGAAVRLPQASLAGEGWVEQVARLAVDRARCAKMGAAMVRLGRPDAARAVVEVLEQAAGV